MRWSFAQSLKSLHKKYILTHVKGKNMIENNREKKRKLKMKIKEINNAHHTLFTFVYRFIGSFLPLNNFVTRNTKEKNHIIFCPVGISCSFYFLFCSCCCYFAFFLSLEICPNYRNWMRMNERHARGDSLQKITLNYWPGYPVRLSIKDSVNVRLYLWSLFMWPIWPHYIKLLSFGKRIVAQN